MRLDKKKQPKALKQQSSPKIQAIFGFSMPEHHIYNNSLFGSITEFEFFKIVLHFEMPVPFLRVNNSHCWVPSNTGDCPVLQQKSCVICSYMLNYITMAATKGQHRLDLTAALSGKYVENVAFRQKSLPTHVVDHYPQFLPTNEKLK